MTVEAAEPARTRGPVRVVGAGLLGASIGLGLRLRGIDVLLDDASPGALALACDLGAGRRSDGTAPALVVVAAPPDVTAAVVAAELRAWPQAVVTDVASVKSGVLARLRDDGADLTRYVGGHPLAGRERSGAVAARGDLFAGRPWVLCSSGSSSALAVAAASALASDLGASAVAMDSVEHDWAVALVSHVPQLAATLVAARLRDATDSAVALAGQGLRDVTRIAASDPALWAQILAGNATPVAEVLRALRGDLDAVLAALDALAREDDGAGPAAGARGTLARAVADGNSGHARIPGKHGTPPTRYAAVTVVVPDAPGELARLLHDVGAAGVNLEDLHLEHSEGQPVALAEISVLPAAREPLSAALRELGWTVPA